MLDHVTTALLDVPLGSLSATFLVAALVTGLAYSVWAGFSAPSDDALSLVRASVPEGSARRAVLPDLVEDVRFAVSPRDGTYEAGLLREIAAQRLRHPVTNLVPDLEAPVAVAILLLGAAAASPASVPAEIPALLAKGRKAILSGERLAIESTMPVKRIIREIEIATQRHAWWDTVALDLMATARMRGSWIVPSDLEPFLATEPALLAALTCPTLGLPPPEAAPLVSHWQAEGLLGTAIPEPWVQECFDGLCLAARRVTP